MAKGPTNEIAVGTEFRFLGDPEGVSWKVVAAPERRADDEGEWDSYRCHQVSGDTSIYPADRNDDGTIDFVGESIESAIEASA